MGEEFVTAEGGRVFDGSHGHLLVRPSASLWSGRPGGIMRIRARSWAALLATGSLLVLCACSSSPRTPDAAASDLTTAQATLSSSGAATLVTREATAVVPVGSAPVGTVVHLAPGSAVILPSATTGMLTTVGSPVALDMSGAQPAAPIALSLPVPDGVDGSHLVLMSSHGGGLRSYAGTYDPVKRTFTAEVDALSNFHLAFVNPLTVLSKFRAFLAQVLTGKGTRKPKCVGALTHAGPLLVGVGSGKKIQGPLWPCVSDIDADRVRHQITNSDTVAWAVDSGDGTHDIPADASINDDVTMELGTVIEAAFGKPGHGVILPGQTQTWTLPTEPDGKGIRLHGELSVGTWLASAMVFSATFLVDVFAGTEKAAATSVVKALAKKDAVYECVVGAATKLEDGVRATPGGILSVTRAALSCVGPLVEALGGSLSAIASLVIDVLTSGVEVIAGGLVGLARSVTGATMLDWYVGFGDWIGPNISTGTTTITFTASHCDGCTVIAYRALTNPTTVDTWGPVTIRGSTATLKVPTSKTKNMAFELAKDSPNGEPYGSSNAVSVVIVGYRGIPTGSTVSAATALRQTSGSWCWAGTNQARITINLAYSVFYDADLATTFGGTYGDHSITEWASPTLPVVGGFRDPGGLYHGGGGEQDAPYC